MSEAQVTSQKILRRRDVERATGLGRSSLYAYMAEGTFPRPIKLSQRSVGWIAAEVDAWIAQRTAASRPGMPL